MTAHSDKLKRDSIAFAVSLGVSIAIVLVHNFARGMDGPEATEYGLSVFFRKGYTWMSAPLFLVAGGLIRHLTRAHPLAIIVGLVFALPLIATYEVAMEPTSHNLLPFEVILWAIMAVPGAIGVLGVIGAKRYRESQAARHRR